MPKQIQQIQQICVFVIFQILSVKLLVSLKCPSVIFEDGFNVKNELVSDAFSVLAVSRDNHPFLLLFLLVNRVKKETL